MEIGEWRRMRRGTDEHRILRSNVSCPRPHPLVLMRSITTAIVCLFLVVVPARSQEGSSLSGGGYAAHHGVGVELQWRLMKRIAVLARAEGFIEEGYWVGSRIDLVVREDTRLYVTRWAAPITAAPANYSAGADRAATSRRAGELQWPHWQEPSFGKTVGAAGP